MTVTLPELWRRATSPDEPAIHDLRVRGLPSENREEPFVDAAELVEVRPLVGQRAEAGPASTLLRREVARRLARASEMFELGTIALVEGHRSSLRQRAEFEAESARLRAANPDWTAEDADAATATFVAIPEPNAPHAGGGAVDITVLDDTGNELDTGCSVNGFELPEACLTGYPGLTDRQRRVREALLDAMTRAGFVNYPYEWWHWSYGDRFWAWSLGRPAAIYDGTAEPR